MPRFHDLEVSDVRRETDDSVSLAFRVPPGNRKEFRFIPGQYLTLRTEIDGHDVRRPYSICSGLSEDELRVGIRLVPGGRFSTHVFENVEVGARLQVMEPDGLFQAMPEPGAERHYAGFAAGSGITPLLSIARSVLELEPRSRFDLFYGNRSVASAMFREALEDLKNRFPARFSLLFVFSREPQETAIQNGRLDGQKCHDLLRGLLNVERVDAFYVCGPGNMADEISSVLEGRGVASERIRRELFLPAPDAGAGGRLRQAAEPDPMQGATDAGPIADVTVILDGIRTKIQVPWDGETILDAALKIRPDMPYACKGGMCCTCRARLVDGVVSMDVNYTLADDERARGFVLACQAHPRSGTVTLDFDFR